VSFLVWPGISIPEQATFNLLAKPSRKFGPCHAQGKSQFFPRIAWSCRWPGNDN